MPFQNARRNQFKPKVPLPFRLRRKRRRRLLPPLPVLHHLRGRRWGWMGMGMGGDGRGSGWELEVRICIRRFSACGKKQAPAHSAVVQRSHSELREPALPHDVVSHARTRCVVAADVCDRMCSHCASYHRFFCNRRACSAAPCHCSVLHLRPRSTARSRCQNCRSKGRWGPVSAVSAHQVRARAVLIYPFITFS
jgi:hypothetical protein